MSVSGKRHMHRGCTRVLVHIALFLALGVILTGTGLKGRELLNDAWRRYCEEEVSLTIFTDKDTGLEAGLKPLFVPYADKEATITNKVINAKRKAVNEFMAAEAAAGTPETEFLSAAADMYAEKAFEVVAKSSGEDKAAEMKAAYESAKEETVRSLCEAAAGASDGITLSDVRSRMNAKTTDNYIIIYYGSAILYIGIACLAFAALLAVLWFLKDEDGRARLGQALEPFDYLMPFLVGVGVFTLYPMVRVFIMSFQENYRLTGNSRGAFSKWGLGNYKAIFAGVFTSGGTTNQSLQFMRALKNTALYVAFTVPITAALAILVAYLLNQKGRLNSLFQTAYFMPMVTTATAVGLVWRWLFNYKNGLINAIIAFFTQFFGTPHNINWLQSGAADHHISMIVLIIYGIWSSLPFTIILLLSGLQNIDENLYTVARVDGSKSARIFFKITVPLLSPTIGLVLIINSISAFKVYTDVFVLWSGKPQDFQMETVAWYIYNNIQTSDGTHSLGIAASAAMVLFVIIFAFTMVQKLIQRKWVYQ